MSGNYTVLLDPWPCAPPRPSAPAQSAGIVACDLARVERESGVPPWWLPQYARRRRIAAWSLIPYPRGASLEEAAAALERMRRRVPRARRGATDEAPLEALASANKSA